MKYARIVDGVVAEVIDAGDKDINTMFTAELVSTMVQDPSSQAVEGSGWNGSNFSDPVPLVMPLTEVRLKRNFYLDNSDWTQGADCQLSNEAKSAWASYRQQLRDVPASYPDITWPEEPI
tara:strand:- start:1158 stop:1517 length:360 start_codon:yes stop_codon:yes gene_type:complete